MSAIRPRLVLAAFDPLTLMTDVIKHQEEGWQLQSFWVETRGHWFWRVVVYFAAMVAIDPPAPCARLKLVIGPVREQRS